MVVSDILLRAVQRGRERHSPPVVNKASVRWPTPSPSTPGLVVEDLEYYVEEGPQGWVPLRIIRPLDEHDKQQPQPSEPAPQEEAAAEAEAAPALADQQSTPCGSAGEGAAVPSATRRPVILFMHATGENMDVVRPKQELYARMGYFTAAIDARYHGQRAAVPWEVAAALNAAAPKLAAPSLPTAAAAAGTGGVAAALVATVKGLNPKALAALERADAAAGLKPGVTEPEAVSSPSAAPPPPLLMASRTMTRSGTRTSAPAGSRTAAAEAREEAEARKRALAHERFVAAWLGAMSEFRERRSAEATTAVLATAPPPPAMAPTPPQSTAAAASGRDGAVVAAIAAAEAAAAAPVVSLSAAGVAQARWAVAHGTRGAAVSRADRVTARNVYELALAAAWRGSGEQPLFLDTVWDLVLLLDALALREEVDMARVGVTGFSMGGTITWFLSVIDPRVTVAAPVSGVQGFGWAVATESYHGRVSRYPLVFEVAATDLKGTKTAQIDAEVVMAVWEKLLPGLLSSYDAHLSLPSIAPRPLLVATGETDQQCPLPGVSQAAEAARASYLKWAKDTRRQQLEAEAVAAMEAAAEAAAAVAATAEAGSAERSNLGLGQQGSGGGAAVGGRSGTGTGGSARGRSATDGGAAAAAANEAAVVEEGSGEEDSMWAAASDEAAWCAAASAAAAAEEEAVVAAAAAAAAAAAHAAAVAAARAAALAAAAEQQRREEEAIGKLLGSRFRYLVEVGVGHIETDGMRRAVERWMQQHLLEPWMRARVATRTAAAAAAAGATAAAAATTEEAAAGEE